MNSISPPTNSSVGGHVILPPMYVCQVHKPNILCKSGAENRAQYVARLLAQDADG